ncbi:HisA/HisF-related TIM barrel protein, partial [Aliarcobacter butzleri]
AKLDVKPPNVVKPVHFEGLSKIGTPQELAKKYYEQDADEVMYIDIVSSLYQREIIFEEIEKTANELFIPFGVGGA